MKKNLNDWVNVGVGCLFTSSIFMFATLFVQAACDGDTYCGLSNASSTACSSSKIQTDTSGKLACYPDGAPGSPVNCNKKNPNEGNCSCSCKSKSNPSSPKVNDPCSCQG